MSSSSSKPSILFVPGSLALPEFYDNVAEAVTSKGYEFKALHPPSVGFKTGPREGPLPSMFDDAALIASEIEKLADQGKDVVLFAHSYGGTPSTQSTKGLSRADRQAQGKKGGLVSLAYMTCVVPGVGESAGSVMANVPEDQQLGPGKGTEIDENGWLSFVDPVRGAAISFSDLPPEEGEAWVRRFAHHSSLSFAGEVTHAGYKDVPVSWLLCEKDLCIPIELQKATIERIEKERGSKIAVTRIEADHIPSAGSKAEEVIAWFLDVAGNPSRS